MRKTAQLALLVNAWARRVTAGALRFRIGSASIMHFRRFRFGMPIRDDTVRHLALLSYGPVAGFRGGSRLGPEGKQDGYRSMRVGTAATRVSRIS